METTPEVRSKAPHSVKILNPPVNCHGFTSQAKARSMVRRGRAEWIKERFSIQLTEAHRHVRATKLVAADMQRVIDRMLAQQRADRGYDSVDRTMTATELKNLPMTGDVSRLLIRR